MKKILLSLLMATGSIYFASAQQTDKGNVLAGGGLSLNFGTANVTQTTPLGTAKLKAPTTFDFTFNPNIGFFLFKGLAVGLKFRTEFNSSKSNDSIYSKKTYLSAGPFIRYYYKIGKIAPFMDVNFGIGKIVNDSHVSNFYTGLNTISKPKGNIIGFGPGIAYFISDKIAVEAAAAIDILSSKDESTVLGTTIKTVNKGTNLRFNIGLQAFL